MYVSCVSKPCAKHGFVPRLRTAPHTTCAAPGISASPSEDNLRYFNVMILGPQQSPYEGGVFKLELFLPEDYPMAPPKVWGFRGARSTRPRARCSAHRHAPSLSSSPGSCVIDFPRLCGGTRSNRCLPRRVHTGALLDKNIPPEHRQAGSHLPRHPEGQVEPSAADPDRAAQVRAALPACLGEGSHRAPPAGVLCLTATTACRRRPWPAQHPSAAERTQPGGPPRRKCCKALEGERAGGHRHWCVPRLRFRVWGGAEQKGSCVPDGCRLSTTALSNCHPPVTGGHSSRGWQVALGALHWVPAKSSNGPCAPCGCPCLVQPSTGHTSTPRANYRISAPLHGATNSSTWELGWPPDPHVFMADAAALGPKAAHVASTGGYGYDRGVGWGSGGVGWGDGICVLNVMCGAWL